MRCGALDFSSLSFEMKRREAIQLNLLRYSTGKPCRRGHLSERSAATSGCLECSRIRCSEYRRRKFAGEIAPRRAVVLAPKSADEKSAYQRAWRVANAERVRELKRLWKLANPDKVRSYKRRWRLANPDRHKNRKRRKRRNAASNSRQRKRRFDHLFKLQRGKCAYCRIKVTETASQIDHITPRAAGGTNRRSNLQLTCVSCNQAKSDRHPVVFAQSLGRLL